VYRTNWDNAIERQAWLQYHIGIDSSTSWYYTPVAVLQGEVLAHAAPALSNSNPMDSWIVSPAFNFSSGGNLDSLIINLSGLSFPSLTDTLGIYLISGSQNPSLGSWQLLKQFDNTDYAQNNGTYQKVPSISIPATLGTSYLAFRYKRIIGQFDVLFDALQVTANFTNATLDRKIPADNIKIYPNPGEGIFTVELNKKLGTLTEINVSDSKGRFIKTCYPNELIDLSSLTKGIYFLRIKTTRNDQVVKEIVIQ